MKGKRKKSSREKRKEITRIGILILLIFFLTGSMIFAMKDVLKDQEYEEIVEYVDVDGVVYPVEEPETEGYLSDNTETATKPEGEWAKGSDSQNNENAGKGAGSGSNKGNKGTESHKNGGGSKGTGKGTGDKNNSGSGNTGITPSPGNTGITPSPGNTGITPSPGNTATTPAAGNSQNTGNNAGSQNTGSSGSTNTGSGGSTNTGSGGSGGSTNTGSGGSTNTGSGGSTNTGSGGSTNTGSSGSTNTGSGGSTNTGSSGENIPTEQLPGKFELKDLEYAHLYQQGNLVDELNISGGLPTGAKLSEFYLEIKPVYSPTLYVNVEKFEQVGGKLFAVGDVDNFITHYTDSNNGIQKVEKLYLEMNYTGSGSNKSTASSQPVGSMLKAIQGFDQANQKKYDNVMRLAPYMTMEEVVEAGNSLSGNLAVKTVIGVYPYDSAGKLVSGLKSSERGKIVKIIIFYQDETFDAYSVTSTGVYDGIVSAYRISGLGDKVKYHFNKPMSEDTLQLANYVSQKGAGLNYEKDIATTVVDDVIRQYTAVYDTEIKTELAAFAQKLVSSEYPNSINNAYLSKRLKSQIDQKLASHLYTYTYLRKSFDFEIGGVNLSDLLFFDPELLNRELTTEALVEVLVKAQKGARAMNRTYDFFQQNIASKTGIELYDYMELLMRTQGYTDYNKWFEEHWGGYVKSQQVIGYTPVNGLKYRIWDNLTKLKGTDAHALHLLTIPNELQKHFSIITAPSQIIIADINVYYSQVNEDTIQKFRQKTDQNSRNYGVYYGTALGFVKDGEENLSKEDMIRVGYDSISLFKNPDFPGAQGGGSEAYKIKWIQEPAGRVTVLNANVAGVANGKYIFYGNMPALDNFGLFTHENAHNQDNSFFMDGEGRRAANAEYYAESLFALEPGGYGYNQYKGMHFNLIHNIGINDNVLTNFTPERINTKEKIQDYYKDLFDSWYATNALYVAPMALTSENQLAKSLRQALKYDSTDPLGPQEIKYNVVNTDLINQYGLNAPGTRMEIYEKLKAGKFSIREFGIISGGYVKPSFLWVHFEEHLNPDGVSDAETFKRLAYEFLGYKGWDQGLVQWASLRSANDYDAIQKITGMTPEAYKDSRYREAFEKLDQIPYFKAEQIEGVIKEFYDRESVLGYDSIYVKEVIVAAVKRVTDDFTDGTIYTRSVKNSYDVNSAEEFVRIVKENKDLHGVFINITGDLDFSQLTPENGAYGEKFMGFIRGNGYTIRGLKSPLLKMVQYAVIGDLTLEGDTQTLLAQEAHQAIMHDLKFDSSKKVAAKLGGNAHTQRLNLTTL